MTTTITVHEGETTETQVCDTCILIAYDMGVQEYDEQVRVMMEIGDICSDHTCDQD